MFHLRRLEAAMFHLRRLTTALIPVLLQSTTVIWVTMFHKILVAAVAAADMRAAVLSQRLAVKFHCEPARALDDGLMT